MHFLNLKGNIVCLPLYHSCYYIQIMTEISLWTLLTNIDLSKGEIQSFHSSEMQNTYIFYQKVYYAY
jgi:hypothetical protein